MLYHVCNGFYFKFYALEFIRDAISRLEKEAKKRVSGLLNVRLGFGRSMNRLVLDGIRIGIYN